MAHVGELKIFPALSRSTEDELWSIEGQTSHPSPRLAYWIYDLGTLGRAKVWPMNNFGLPKARVSRPNNLGWYKIEGLSHGTLQVVGWGDCGAPLDWYRDVFPRSKLCRNVCIELSSLVIMDGNIALGYRVHEWLTSSWNYAPYADNPMVVGWGWPADSPK